MQYIFGFLAGAVWGFLAGLLTAFIMKKTVSGSGKVVFVGNIARTLISIAALLAVVLLRERLPFNYMLAIVGTAAGLSVTTIYAAFKIAAK